MEPWAVSKVQSLPRPINQTLWIMDPRAANFGHALPAPPAFHIGYGRNHVHRRCVETIKFTRTSVNTLLLHRPAASFNRIEQPNLAVNRQKGKAGAFSRIAICWHLADRQDGEALNFTCHPWHDLDMQAAWIYRSKQTNGWLSFFHLGFQPALSPFDSQAGPVVPHSEKTLDSGSFQLP